MSHGFVRDSIQLEDMELPEWFDNDWEDVDITIDRDLVVISEVTWPRTAEPPTTAGRSP